MFGFGISGRSSVVLVGPRFILGKASDLFVLILRLLLTQSCHNLIMLCPVLDTPNLFSHIIVYLGLSVNYMVFSFFVHLGVPVCQFKMQEVLPQQIEAIQAYMDSHV